MSANIAAPPQFPIMTATERHLRQNRPDQGEKHVPLGVPDFALGAEKGLGRRPLATATHYSMNS